MKKIFEPNDKCPVFCRKCGINLAVEKRWIEGIRYHSFLGSSKLDERVMITCPKRLTIFGFFYGKHDRREFSADCESEFNVVTIE